MALIKKVTSLVKGSEKSAASAGEEQWHNPRPTATYKLWRKLGKKPFGSVIFTIGVCLRAPYFRTVYPHVRQLRPGLCEVKGPHWWGNNNHIGTFHAIAACNLAEIAMGMLAEATVPTTHRWIPKSMHTQYLTKSTGSLVATGELNPIPDFDAITKETGGRDVVVPVRLIDEAGKEAVHADITIWVTAK